MAFEDLETILFIDLVLWAFVLLVPPIVIRTKRLWYFRARPSGMAFMNIILIKRDAYSERILRHELEHVKQQRMFSPFGMALFIILHYGWLLLRYRSFRETYKRSWLERKANEAMDKTGDMPFVLSFGKKIGRDAEL